MRCSTRSNKGPPACRRLLELRSGALLVTTYRGGAVVQLDVAAREVRARRAADAPEVNLIEGWVLHVMMAAQRCFEEAHTATQLVPRLNAGAATRHVLGPKRGGAKADAKPNAEPLAPSGPKTDK